MSGIMKCCLLAAVSLSIVFSTDNAVAQNAHAIEASKQQVIDHWTPERRANAIPRDLVIDSRGLGYMRKPDGSLQPYGHRVAALAKSPMAKPVDDSSDTTPPNITNANPGSGATIGAAQVFSATITDASGVKSVSFTLQKSGGIAQSFTATSAGDSWGVSLSGFTDGDWSWSITAKDNAGRGGNTATAGPFGFKVDTGGIVPPPPPADGIVINEGWDGGPAVQNAAGRIYFEMPSNSKLKGPWNGYVCSGTVATDSVGGRSVIITAAHCVYDDANKAFARNIMFIPDQDGTTGSRTDRDCSNDPYGCWVTSFGVVDKNWTTRTFPDNIPWDYAFYVVEDQGSHQGTAVSNDALDVVVGSLPISFNPVVTNDGTAGGGSDFTYALGYSYSDDPFFMYCAEDMTTEGADNWWLPSCGLSGGSSGGPWVQPMNKTAGSGDIISVNSWGYTGSPGMAGPKLAGTSASCVWGDAISNWVSNAADGQAGYISVCP